MALTPESRPARKGVGTAERMHLSSSVHNSGNMGSMRNPIIESGDCYSQLNQIRSYFHDTDDNRDEDRPSGTGRSYSRDGGAERPQPPAPGPGDLLARVPSVSIFRSLPHFPLTETELRDDSSSARPLRCGGSAPLQMGTSLSAVSSPAGLPGAAEDSNSPASYSLGRSSAIPIAIERPVVNHSVHDDFKMAGSFREENAHTSPMMAMQYSGSSGHPSLWSPAKPGRASPTMSPFRNRGNTDEE